MQKNIILPFILLIFSTGLFAQQSQHQLSSHILDITQGAPAADVKISLAKMDKHKNWIFVEEKYTDDNGRIKDFLKQDGADNKGIYKLTYFTESYFNKLNQPTFYPFIEVVFEIKDDKHYHVPITLSPYGYATYRGN